MTDADTQSVISRFIKRFREDAPASAENRRQFEGGRESFWWLTESQDNSTRLLENIDLNDSNKEKIDHKYIDQPSLFRSSSPTITQHFNNPCVSLELSKSEINPSLSMNTGSSIESDLDKYTEKLLNQCEGLLKQYYDTSMNPSLEAADKVEDAIINDDSDSYVDSDSDSEGSQTLDSSDEYSFVKKSTQRNFVVAEVPTSHQLSSNASMTDKGTNIQQYVPSNTVSISLPEVKNPNEKIAASEICLDENFDPSVVYPDEKDLPPTSKSQGLCNTKPEVPQQLDLRSDLDIHASDRNKDEQDKSGRNVVEPIHNDFNTESELYDHVHGATRLEQHEEDNLSLNDDAVTDGVGSVFMFLSPASSCATTSTNHQTIEERADDRNCDSSVEPIIKIPPGVENANLSLTSLEVTPYMNDCVVRYLWERLQQVRHEMSTIPLSK